MRWLAVWRIYRQAVEVDGAADVEVRRNLRSGSTAANRSLFPVFVQHTKRCKYKELISSSSS